MKRLAIPIENASQIEIMKGASSVLYGSGALNGVISLSEREPNKKGEVRAKVQAGIYDNPKRESLKWWSSNPMYYQAEAYYGKMFDKFGFTISANGFSSDGYKQGEIEDRGRVSGSLFFRPKKFSKLKYGIGYNLQFQKTGNFLIWESDSLAYTPSGGADPNDSTSTLSSRLHIILKCSTSTTTNISHLTYARTFVRTYLRSCTHVQW